MNASCSQRLDWEYRIRRSFNWSTFVVFIVLGIFAFMLATSVWKAATQDSAVQSLYWGLQPETAVEYAQAQEFNKWPWNQHALCLLWMLLVAIYFGSLAEVVFARIAEFFDR